MLEKKHFVFMQPRIIIFSTSKCQVLILQYSEKFFYTTGIMDFGMLKKSLPKRRSPFVPSNDICKSYVKRVRSNRNVLKVDRKKPMLSNRTPSDNGLGGIIERPSDQSPQNLNRNLEKRFPT